MMKDVSVLAKAVFFSLIFMTASAKGADGYGQYATGGAGGTTVTASTAEEFETYTESSSTYIIEVEGTIDLAPVDGEVNIKSNKTIRGTGPGSTIKGQLSFQNGSSNIIIEKLTITNPDGYQEGDGVSCKDNITNVFITKCTFVDCDDGCLDISNGSDFVTVSWCKFYYVNQSSHRNVNLIGSSDGASGDMGKLHVTFHHNWWSSLCTERMPSVRYGRAHVYNNYYSCVGNSYCVRTRLYAQCLVENNYFQEVQNPWERLVTSAGGDPGLLRATGNILVNPIWDATWYEGVVLIDGSDTVFTPPYPYTLDPAADVPDIVIGGAGNTDDNTSPTPDPMTWATEPHGVNPTSITMVATTATDTSGAEYFFDCTAGGGHDSGWQNSTTYTDTGLTFGITYSYQVKARDKSANHNETGYSSVESASPVADTIAPTPDPMTWATAPAATGIDAITMTATTATDASGVEYFFACTSGGGNDSGWQDSASYTDTGLANNTTYTYRVMARDKSAGQNETGWSDEESATTLRYICSGAITSDLNDDCEVDFVDYATLASGWGTPPGVVVELVTNGGFDTDISSWTLVNLSSATGTMTATFDGVAGNPAGSALVSTNTGTTGANEHRFYQVVPVTVGNQYTLSGEWSGNIVGLVTNPTGGSLRNWAEVFIGFETSTTPADWTATSIKYKKAVGSSTTNTSTGIWGWEPITSSPSGSVPAGGIYTATAPYMVIAFNLGGRANSGETYINVDNISVVDAGGPVCPANDLNADCAFDWLDIQAFASDWLDCNRNPGSECWQ